MKAFKKLASLCLGLILCAGLYAFAACEKETAPESSSPVESSAPAESSSPVESSAPAESSSSEGEAEATAYVFTVLDKDGNPLKDMAILLCIPGQGCFPPIYTDENGKAISEKPAQVLEIHVANKGDEDNYLDFEGEQKTAATYGEYTLKLKA